MSARVPLALAACLLVAACTTTSGVGPQVVNLGLEPYCVGELKIWIRPQEEVDVLCRMAQPTFPWDRHILGCYIDETRTIVCIDDAWVLMHELKHFFEGGWHR
jgi:hypothetical protein